MSEPIEGLAIFWVNCDNFRGVIIRNKDKTIEQQIRDFYRNRERSDNIANCYAVEILIDPGD